MWLIKILALTWPYLEHENLLLSRKSLVTSVEGSGSFSWIGNGGSWIRIRLIREEKLPPGVTTYDTGKNYLNCGYWRKILWFASKRKVKSKSDLTGPDPQYTVVIYSTIAHHWSVTKNPRNTTPVGATLTSSCALNSWVIFLSFYDPKNSLSTCITSRQRTCLSTGLLKNFSTEIYSDLQRDFGLPTSSVLKVTVCFMLRAHSSWLLIDIL
jgi:hypothetical protein